ncbi:MAG TPA: multicopper oxidase domain-containing protein [Saprospiraceae bacterium]|nr:multicopper oxidase domain-containing protein [Saprospiraceae bacterium]
MKQTSLFNYILLVFFAFTESRVKAATIDVYVYNTEFSIYPQGEPVTAAIITQGDSIRWLWVQGGHTTTSVSGSSEQWDQPINSSNTSYIRQFNAVGVFWYYCIPHGTDNGDGTASGMASTITVLPAGSGACCLPDGMCTTATEGECLTQDGAFSGVGSLCDTTYCAVAVELIAAEDNILYEDAEGDVSNGLGVQLYTGNNANGRRRTVVAFDLSGIPDGAEVEDAQLKLYCNSSAGATVSVTLQKLFQDWGEGTSDAGGNETDGAPATTDDATWIHTFYDTAAWIAEGGSFDTTICATTEVSTQNAFYFWSSAQMNEDVQYWLHMPDENFGWIVRGDETSTANTKRFSSRQNGISANHPRLIIDYVVPPRGACCLPDGTCEDLTAMQCGLESGEYNGDGTSCEDVTCSVQLTPFLDALPLPGVAVPQSGNAGGTAHYRITMTEQLQQLHTDLPPTRVWGYNGSYPGPTIEAFRDSLVTVQWVNDLRDVETDALRTSHALYIDTCLHGPDMTGTVPVTVVHLHGGKVSPGSDGYPEATFPPGDSSGIYQYPNIQPAGTLWYHDHALGITRLNVMMGLAGFYLIRDSNELSLDLPSGEYEIPLAIQDRSFDADGSLQYPETWDEHFFGNTILVNGKVWPYLYVKQGKYRFRVLNGSNSRAYTLHLSNGAPFIQIGTELGLLDIAAVLDSLTLLPGERYDLVIDFSSFAPGTEIILTNSAPAPFPGFPGVGVMPNVMKFIVQGIPGYTDALPDTLNEIEELLEQNSDQERLFELMTMTTPPCAGHTHNMWTINGMQWDDITEFPVYGSTEIWTWHNQSGISHPMHMHLVAMQVLDRQAINESTGEPEGPLLAPNESERGWKDTAHSPPGFRTRVIARFDGFTGLYPYHCHILEHEDHEMMRQFDLRPCTDVTNTASSGPGSLRYAIDCAEAGDTILFDISLVGDTIHLADSLLVDKDLRIDNTHAGAITISGQGIAHLLVIGAGSGVGLKHLDLISGSGTNGRALINHGTLLLDDVTIYDSVIDPMSGNTILNNGELIAKNNCSVLFLQE